MGAAAEITERVYNMHVWRQNREAARAFVKGARRLGFTVFYETVLLADKRYLNDPNEEVRRHVVAFFNKYGREVHRLAKLLYVGDDSITTEQLFRPLLWMERQNFDHMFEELTRANESMEFKLDYIRTNALRDVSNDRVVPERIFFNFLVSDDTNLTGDE